MIKGVETGASPVITRRWKYAAPPWRLFDALVDEHDRWLSGPRHVVVAAAARPDRVLFRPWIDDGVDQIEIGITPNAGGSQLTVTALCSASSLTDERRHELRHRLGTIFGAALREWVDW
jgi:hypothetical protein